MSSWLVADRPPKIVCVLWTRPVHDVPSGGAESNVTAGLTSELTPPDAGMVCGLVESHGCVSVVLPCGPIVEVGVAR